MKTEWQYDLVEKSFREQLKAVGWQRLEGDTDLPELTDLLTGRVRVSEHFGVRRHDAALSSRAHEPASGPLRPETAHESGDTSPHSKGDAP
jgi:hypothetical protein